MTSTDWDSATVRVVDADQLDMKAHAALQQRVFGDVLKANDIPLSRLSADVFAWKLAPPAGPGRVSIAEYHGEIVASCSSYPVRLGDKDHTVSGWHLFDAATAPEARGHGLYRRVLAALCESFSPDEWLYGLPNEQSRHAFDRRGFTRVEQVPLWFRPVISRRGAMPEEVVPVAEFGPEFDDLAVRLRADRGLTAVRSAAYLNWRYIQHPFFAYRCFALRRNERIDGFAVVNPMAARGRVSMWVMELMAVDDAGEKTLAKAIRATAATTGCDVILAISSARLPGALRLPQLFLPKKNILLVRSGGTSDPKPIGRWDVFTGDWDTF